MVVNNDPNFNGAVTQAQHNQPKNFEENFSPVLGWKEAQKTSAKQRSSSSIKKRRRLLASSLVVLLVLLIFASVRVSTIASDSNDQLQVRIGNQQTAIVDLRQSLPISPYLYGVNAFPESGTSSLDKPYSGFMAYTPQIVSGLTSINVKLLRFPGGEWGEQHILSIQQLNDFSALLNEVGADGMIQARLSGSADLAQRVNLAGQWVDYMNNPHSNLRKGANAKAPYHPIKFWTVGNEPDRLINPATGKTFTVADYVSAFIAYSKFMHQNDPTIKIFGPEISQFYGLGAGPTDSLGNNWMEGFLKGVGAYEKANHVVLLDGVSFHRYQFDNAAQAPAMLMSSPNEWDYLLPSLQQLIRQDLGRDVPVAVTEVNSNPNNAVPTPGIASLWWADTLGSLMNQQVGFVGYFSTQGVERPYPLFTTDNQRNAGGASITLQQTAMFRVMQLYSHLQPNLVPVDVQREPISIYATQDDSHQTVSLIFINKSSTLQLAQVSAQNQLFGVSPWHTLDVSLLGYSIVVVTMHRGAGAEAYSFVVPTLQYPTVQTLKYSVCGNKSDPLANSPTNYIPC